MVQFYAWFKFSFLLFQTHYHVIIIHYHTHKQKKRKFEPKDKIKPQYMPNIVLKFGKATRFNARISSIILLHEKFLQFDGLRAVVFQLNLKYPTCENYKPFAGSSINN